VGKLLYETRPDLFPEGYLTQTETEIWALYIAEQNQKIEAANGGR